jgi:L-ascorbate metabolism protein UlaG (beta-lactamase superfamily)
MEFTYHGHSCFSVVIEGKHLLFDPFITFNDLANNIVDVDSVQAGNFYYSGDTALTLDMQLIPRWAKLNFAVLPIGDNFTMDATDAAECARMIGCNTIIGVHYDTFGFIKINREEAKKAFAATGATLHLVPIGNTVTL